jgi:hypothetical protein
MTAAAHTPEGTTPSHPTKGAAAPRTTEVATLIGTLTDRIIDVLEQLATLADADLDAPCAHPCARGGTVRSLLTHNIDHERMDMAQALLLDTLAALESGREDTMLRVLEVKAAAGEASTEVTQLGMRVCGGAAFRKEVGVERHFRDARAATVMAPTTDVLYDFIGKAAIGMPLFG